MHSFKPIAGYTTSVRTLRGRLILHIDIGALLKLGASDGNEAAQLATLYRHMPRFHALALQLAAGLKTEVTVEAADVGWNAAEAPTRTRQRLRVR
jgi:hypothetical protein